MKPTLTSKEIEARFKKAKNPIVVEISGNLSVQSRAAHLNAFLADAKRLISNNRSGVLLVVIAE